METFWGGENAKTLADRRAYDRTVREKEAEMRADKLGLDALRTIRRQLRKHSFWQDVSNEAWKAEHAEVAKQWRRLFCK